MKRTQEKSRDVPQEPCWLAIRPETEGKEKNQIVVTVGAS